MTDTLYEEILADAGLKKCAQCRTWRSPQCFAGHNKTVDHKRHVCKSCVSAGLRVDEYLWSPRAAA